MKLPTVSPSIPFLSAHAHTAYNPMTWYTETAAHMTKSNSSIVQMLVYNPSHSTHPENSCCLPAWEETQHNNIDNSHSITEDIHCETTNLINAHCEGGKQPEDRLEDKMITQRVHSPFFLGASFLAIRKNST